MILRSIRVEGWRCFAAAVEVGPFSDGLNVIHGPNGIGKSTLMMALVRGLFDSHGVSGDQIKSLRPWGRSLIPKVTIEFEQEGTHYRLHKQFLSSASAQLSRMENGQLVPLAEARAADDQAREVLSGDAPGRGVTDHRHWGLAQILWATQGRLHIDHLSSGTQATIQGAIGAEVSGPGAERFENKISDTYGEIFTPTGKLKQGASAPAIVSLKQQLEEANLRRTELLRRMEDFDAASRRIEDLKNAAAQFQNSEQELSDKLKVTREHAKSYDGLLKDRKLHEQEVIAAKERYKHLSDKIHAITETRKEVEAARDKLKQIQDDAPAQAKYVEQCRERAERAKQAVEQVRARRDQVQEAKQTSQMAQLFISSRESLDQTDKLIEQIEGAHEESATLRQRRSEVIAPDKKTLQELIATARARDEARIKLDAAVITVLVTPEDHTEIDITLAEEPGKKTLTDAKPLPIKGAPDVAFQIPGVAHFEATGPTEGVDQLRAEWEQTTEKLDELTAGFGTQDLDELDQLHAQATELDGLISQVDVRVEALLGGRKLEEIRSDRARTSSVVEEIVTKFRDWQDSPPDVVALAQHAETMHQQFVKDIDAAEAENDLARDSLNAAVQQQTSHDADSKHSQREIAAIEKRLASLCDDGLDDTKRSDALTEIAIERDAGQGKFTSVEEKLAAFGDDPGKVIGVMEGHLRSVREDATEAARQQNTEQGRLEQICAEAPYSALAVVEEDINRLEGDIDTQQLQIGATRLLYETLLEQKRGVLQSVLGPVRIRAKQTLQRIAGTRFDDIQFDESLLPTGVAPRSADGSVTLDQISGGELEQLHFAVRLALADVAFDNQRQLVVLDDVFTFTDTTRLARIATILDEAADRFQIVLLTCHPERYRGLPNAQFFDLEKITNESSSA